MSKDDKSEVKVTREYQHPDLLRVPESIKEANPDKDFRWIRKDNTRFHSSQDEGYAPVASPEGKTTEYHDLRLMSIDKGRAAEIREQKKAKTDRLTHATHNQFRGQMEKMGVAAFGEVKKSKKYFSIPS